MKLWSESSHEDTDSDESHVCWCLAHDTIGFTYFGRDDIVFRWWTEPLCHWCLWVVAPSLPGGRCVSVLSLSWSIFFLHLGLEKFGEILSTGGILYVHRTICDDYCCWILWVDCVCVLRFRTRGVRCAPKLCDEFNLFNLWLERVGVKYFVPCRTPLSSWFCRFIAKFGHSWAICFGFAFDSCSNCVGFLSENSHVSCWGSFSIRARVRFFWNDLEVDSKVMTCTEESSRGGIEYHYSCRSWRRIWMW